MIIRNTISEKTVDTNHVFVRENEAKQIQSGTATRFIVIKFA